MLRDAVLRGRRDQRWGTSIRARRTRDESGAALVEFALILVPFLLLVFGLIQYGIYFYAAQTGSHAVNTAARQLSVGKCTDPDELLDFVEAELGASAVANSTTVDTDYFMSDGSDASGADTVDVGGMVKVTITFDTINLEFPLLPYLDDGEVTREIDARVEYVPQPGCGA
jgi:Flp pilus assembly protein TadG